MTLPPLDEEAIGDLLAAGAAGELPAGTDYRGLAQRLHAETRGLPLFVVEYVELLRSGTLAPLAAKWPAPYGVRQFLHERLAGLSETAQQVISTAAVIGHSFDTETVVAASGRSEDEAVGALEELLALRLVLEQGADSFDFAHAQLPGIVYDDISKVRKRLLHRRVADALAAGARRSRISMAGVAAALAYHYELGGVLDKAAHWAVTAGEHARQVYANREAIRHYEKALALGAEDECAIHLHLGDLHTLQGEYSQALESYLQARRACLAAGGEAEGEIEHRLGRLHHRLGDAAQAVCHFAAALEHLPTAAAQSRALVLVDWSLALPTACTGWTTPCACPRRRWSRLREMERKRFRHGRMIFSAWSRARTAAIYPRPFHRANAASQQPHASSTTRRPRWRHLTASRWHMPPGPQM